MSSSPRCFFSILVVTVFSMGAPSRAAAAPDSPRHLTVEHLQKPMGIDAREPRFSWWVGDPAPGAVQSAYEIQIAEGSPVFEAEGKTLWTSGKVGSDQSVDVVCGGHAWKPGTRYHWRVRTWNGAGEPSAWSEPAWLETGLFDRAAWDDSQWIAHPPRNTTQNVPSPFFRTEFVATKPVKSARLYATAQGLYRAWINGRRVGDDAFTPGWTDYAKRDQYFTYDVTALLRSGSNALGAELGEGWYSGTIVSRKNYYGPEPGLRMRLVLTYADGSKQIVATGASWKVTTGPILSSDIYMGENYDARLELGAWSEPGYDASKWDPVAVQPEGAEEFTGRISQPIRIENELAPKTVNKAGDEWVFDLGQNMVGLARLKLKGKAGQTVRLRYAEMLNANGTLYVANLRAAKATDYYTFAKDGEIEWQPIFTYHGFRYVGLSGVDAAPGRDAITGLVMHADMPATGRFSCSHPLLNQLQSNIVWGQRGNFFDVPTDCPQRDERLGWTGDAQIFIRTATFNYDVQAFFEKWLMDMRDAQTADGQVPDVIPSVIGKNSTSAWGDAAVICPWVIYQQYGDRRILTENLEMMKRWVDWQATTAPKGVRPSRGYGDWLALDRANPKRSDDTATPKDLVATAYFAHGADLVSRSADVLGRTEEAQRYRALFEKVRVAFQKRFFRPDGSIEGNTQTVYLLALNFGLLPGGQRAGAVDRLVADIQGRNWHLSTGFLGTGVLLPTLGSVGRQDVAFKVLLGETYPGWLYSIRQGATTTWERWNSYTHEKGFGPVSMNSFNHYAYGAVGEWLYAVIGGLSAQEPGFKKSLIKPVPGGGLTSADCSLDTPYGVLGSKWTLDNGRFHLTATVPPNTRARIELPDGSSREVGAGTFEFHVPVKPGPPL